MPSRAASPGASSSVSSWGSRSGWWQPTWIAVALGAQRPVGVTWRGVWAIGLVAGIGFTVALFVGDLAYSDPDLLRDSKIGIIAAFAIAGPLAFLGFRLLPKAERVDRPAAIAGRAEVASAP